MHLKFLRVYVQLVVYARQSVQATLTQLLLGMLMGLALGECQTAPFVAIIDLLVCCAYKTALT